MGGRSWHVSPGVRARVRRQEGGTQGPPPTRPHQPPWGVALGVAAPLPPFRILFGGILSFPVCLGGRLDKAAPAVGGQGRELGWVLFGSLPQGSRGGLCSPGF